MIAHLGLPNQSHIIGDEHMKALGLGLAGAHRTGKTTVGERVAKDLDVPFVASSGSQVAKDMGLKVDVGMPILDRLAFQERVLEVFEERYAEHNGLFVTDRTPLDFAAYLIADWTSGKDAEIDQRVRAYIDECYAVTNRYFLHLSVIQPGIPYHSEPGKPAFNTSYQETLNTLILGLAWDDAVTSSIDVMPRNVLDLDTRVSAVISAYNAHLGEYTSTLANELTLH